MGADLHFDQEVQHGVESPMAQPLTVYGRKICNRFTVLPMEGWDGETDGMPNELVERRWQRFGLSGAKLIWGGEAVAVRPDGRANPNQLMINEQTIGALAKLRAGLEWTHRDHHGTTDDLRRLQRPIDQRKWGESSWVNYWLGRDEGLWTRSADVRSIRLELPMLPSGPAAR